MFVSIAIVYGLLAFISTALVLASCFASSSARQITWTKADSRMAALRPTAYSAYVAESAA